MVTGFNRSFSFPGSPRLKTRPAPQKSYHVRSISLPSCSHPLISHLEDAIRSVSTWQSSQPESSSSASLSDGLARLELLHLSLNDLLGLPQNQDSLRLGSGSEWTGRVLDDFLRLADAHGSLRSKIVALKDHQSEAQIAIRRKDSFKLESSTRSMKKVERRLAKLSTSLREQSKSSIQVPELAGIIREVINVTVSASAVLFIGIASVSAATAGAAAIACSSRSSSSWISLKKRSTEREEEKEEVCRRNAMKKFQEFEECIGAVEKKSERVFRILLNTRASLLGLMAPL